MAKPRDTEIEMNFDGLADSLTDLVGTLLLLVFIIIGITHDPAPPAPPPNDPLGGWTPPRDERSVESLLEKLTSVRAEIQILEREIGVREEKIPFLQERVDELVRRASSQGVPTGSPATSPATPKQKET